jgi:outer membrane protein assembly factor BamB
MTINTLRRNALLSAAFAAVTCIAPHDGIAQTIPAAPATRPTSPVNAATPDRHFSFIHASDIHVETYTSNPQDLALATARSFPCVSTFKDLGAIAMRPFGVTAQKPSFFMVTGDTTEFGFSGATGDVLLRYFQGVTQPVYFAPGNHDNTWAPPTLFYKKRYGSENYSFDFGGCHFICLNSASLQDPSPSFGEETIRFLRNDLRTRDNTTPIFCYCHHPLYGNEFASHYDSDRVIDTLRAWNMVLFFVGHGHSSVKHDFAGIPGVMGGSTFSNGNQDTIGYNVVQVDGDRLRVAYRRQVDPQANKPMFDLPIPKRANYPSILPQAGLADVDGRRVLQLGASINGTAAPLKEAFYDLDDETSAPLKIEGAGAAAILPVAGLVNGAHFARVTFVDQQGHRYQRSTSFFLDEGNGTTAPLARWRRALGGSSRSTPLVNEGHVYVGANDGKCYAFETATGKPTWTFDAKAEVATSPAWYKGLVLFGAADGKFYAVDAADGKQKWSYDAALPIFSSPVVDESGTVYFGSNNGVMTALDAATGALRWKNTDAQYSIESKPLLHGGKLFAGAWDGYLYCYDCATGKTTWRKPGTYNMKRVVRYYAPADASPVVQGGKLYVADRGFFGGVYGLDGWFGGKVADEVAAFGTSADGHSLYVRSTRDGVSKLDAQTTTTWESNVVAGRIPAAPIEKDGRVYVITNRGELNVLDAATGKGLWQYRVTPRLYCMAAPAVDANTVYAAGQDGVLTAIQVPQ